MRLEVEEVQLIPIALIRVLNPRVRDRKRFELIIDNIERVGLKKPITVTPTSEPSEGGPAYDLVCGQGRVEAFLALKQTHIPAIVRGYDRANALLASLVENIARRRVRAIDQIQAIRWMHENGQSNAEIARKTGFVEPYVEDLVGLLKRGEDRLLDAALHERIPLTIAMKIAEAADDDTQRILMEAYERKEVTQKTLTNFRDLIQQRKAFGRQYDHGRSRSSPRSRNSVDEFVNSYRAQADRQKLMIKKARLCEARLLSITAAFRVLMADEDFVTLLRAEKMGTLPRFLADRMKEDAS